MQQNFYEVLLHWIHLFHGTMVKNMGSAEIFIELSQYKIYNLTERHLEVCVTPQPLASEAEQTENIPKHQHCLKEQLQ